MNAKDHVLVLNISRYDDYKNIVQCWTRQSGMQSFYVRTGNGAKSSRRRILFKPAQWLEIQYVEKPRQLPVATSVSRLYVYRSLPGDLRKTAVIYLITDLLRQTQKWQNADPAFFDWTFEEIRRFDQAPFQPDFHLHFLLRLSDQLGISPLKSQNGTIFDSAIKDYSSPGMNEQEARLLEQFFHRGKTASRKERQALLDIWLRYFQYHIEGFKPPGVIKIYNEIF